MSAGQPAYGLSASQHRMLYSRARSTLFLVQAASSEGAVPAMVVLASESWWWLKRRRMLRKAPNRGLRTGQILFLSGNIATAPSTRPLQPTHAYAEVVKI